MSEQSRAARRAFYENKEKETYRLLKRFQALARARWSRNPDNLIKLDVPIQRGWMKYFDIREDLKHGPKKEQLKKLLDVIQNPVICMDKEFVIKRRGKIIKQVVIEPKKLDRKEWEALPQELKKYFVEVEVTRSWGGPIKLFVLKQPWMFVEKIKKHYITHLMKFESDAISEYELLQDKLWNSDMMALKYLDHQSDPDSTYNYEKIVRKDKASKRQMNEDLNEYFEPNSL